MKSGGQGQRRLDTVIHITFTCFLHSNGRSNGKLILPERSTYRLGIDAAKLRLDCSLYLLEAADTIVVSTIRSIS